MHAYVCVDVGDIYKPLLVDHWQAGEACCPNGSNTCTVATL